MYSGQFLSSAYAPCNLHGGKGGTKHCQGEMKASVKVDDWNLFSFNPARKAKGKHPFTCTSKPGDGSYQVFLANETRDFSLARTFPERAKDLFAKSEEAAQKRGENLLKLVELYK